MVPQLLETIMLVCFGASWPFSILKTWRTRQVAGKSPVFLLLIFAGYAAGFTAKCLRASSSGAAPEPVTWLYAFNAALVLTDLFLYMRFARRRV